MSDFSVPVVKIGKLTKHLNADSLSITEVDGCPVICKTADFKEGDLAIYIPVEAVVPFGRPAFEFLRDPNHPERDSARIKAKRLRGVFSMGLLIPVTAFEEKTFAGRGEDGRDVAKFLGITKYEEPEPIQYKLREEKPWWKTVLAWVKHPGPMLRMLQHNRRMAKIRKLDFLPVYDMESLRKYRTAIQPDEMVYVSEKIHGTNFRCGYHKGQFYVGSHKCFKGESTTDLYWKTAMAHNLEEKLKFFPHLAVYGEIYGSKVQDLTYGAKPGEIKFACFDLYDTEKRRFVDYEEFLRCTNAMDLPRPPNLFVGRYSEVEDSMAGGKTAVPGANNIREGFVIKPVIERRAHVGRVIFKLVSEAYLLRANGTESH